MEKLEFSVSLEKDSSAQDLLKLNGNLNEDSAIQLEQIDSNKIGKTCIIDFSHITHINSSGVRSWIEFLRKLEKNRKIIYIHCNSSTIVQLNMVPSFRSTAKIQSILGNFYCKKCKLETSQTLNVKDITQENILKHQCSKCKNNLIPSDDLEDFLKIHLRI